MAQTWRMIKKNREYAERLQKRRWALDLSIREVAAATGLSQPVISQYENLRCRPSEASRLKLDAYYSDLEAKRRAESSNSAVEHPALIQQSREVIRSAIDQMMELLVKLEEICSASADAGADQKARDER